CRSAHCAKPAFSLHPSRDVCCLSFLRREIKSRSRADQEQINGRSTADRWQIKDEPAWADQGLSD
ncbi:hypothetical protein, partial [Pseudomonas sp. ME-P-057]|uniref:hypothetical protein n=1 Tax=Pseudomonas sp. ME-P-057 TaxID=3040321 RepID=UPI00255799AB